MHVVSYHHPQQRPSSRVCSWSGETPQEKGLPICPSGCWRRGKYRLKAQKEQYQEGKSELNKSHASLEPYSSVLQAEDSHKALKKPSAVTDVCPGIPSAAASVPAPDVPIPKSESGTQDCAHSEPRSVRYWLRPNNWIAMVKCRSWSHTQNSFRHSLAHGGPFFQF